MRWGPRERAATSAARAGRLNPVALAAIIVAEACALPFVGFYGYLTFLAFSLAVMAWHRRDALSGPLVFLVCFGAAFFILRQVSADNLYFSSLFGALVMLFRLLPMLCLAYALSAYSASELLSACRNMRAPQSLSIGFTVFWCYLAQIASRIRALRLALRIRKLSRPLSHPIRSIEHHLVPLLFQSIDVASSMTCSIIMKGIGYPCVKTNYRDIRIRAFDLALLAFTLALAVACVQGGW